MNQKSFICGTIGSQRAALVLAATLALTGCGRNSDIKVYRTSKEEPPATAPAMSQQTMPPGHPDIAAALPQVQYQLPAGWQQGKPSSMRVASFAVPGKDGQNADVSVIPLPPGGSELELVNMWRSQLHLAPVVTADAGAQEETVAIGADQGKLFDMTSEAPLDNGSNHTRILVAMLSKDGMNWYFKMTGDEPLVTEQKPMFMEFLKSISFAAPTTPMEMTGNPHAMMANELPTSAESDSAKPVWTVPPGWQEAPAGQFLVAKYLVAGNGGAQAAVNVSMSSGNGGGLAANVNRWRGQLGLPPVAEILTTPIDVAGDKGVLVDMGGTDAKTGQPSRLVGVIVSQTGQTWFYKLMGDSAVVEREKDAFTKFVQSVKY